VVSEDDQSCNLSFLGSGLDIALDCAAVHNADPSTLVRNKEPRFAATVALFAVTHLLAGSGYDPPVSDVNEAEGAADNGC